MNIYNYKKLLREQRLEEEQQNGRRVSKTFGGRPSSKELRRKEKDKLRKMIREKKYEED
jgi:hypothetical protein